MNGGRDPNRNELTARANVARARLLRTVAELDRRRHEALNLGLQMRRHVAGVIAATGVSALLLGAGIALAVHRVTTAPRRRRRARWKMIGRFWRHPERFGHESPSFTARLVRSIATGVLTAMVVTPARAAIQRAWRPKAKALPPPPSPPPSRP